MASSEATPTAIYNGQLFGLGETAAGVPPLSGVLHLRHAAASAGLANVHAGQYRNWGTAAAFNTVCGLRDGGEAGLNGSGAVGGGAAGVARFITRVLSASSATDAAADSTA